MYYEEAVINGILCSRGTPDGEWIPLSIESLSAQLLAARIRIEELETRLSDMAKIIRGVV